MSEWKKPYLTLLSAFDYAIEYIEDGKFDAARLTLIKAMQDAEEAFVSYGETEDE
ncbi:MAG: hypothetical protein IJ027_02960 [Oscillospiraceae bacterium]|nr:hypothetical protein [Oscillospiraceae bacterium]